MGSSYQGRYGTKEINIQKLQITNEKEFVSELSLISDESRKHPDLLQFLGFTKVKSMRASDRGGDFVYLIYDRYFCSLSSLRKNDPGIATKYSFSDKITWFATIARAMLHLEKTSNGTFVHGQLNLTQMKMTTDKTKVVLHNYLLKNLRNIRQKGFSDFYWRSPEDFRDKGNSQASDMYAFGISIWEILQNETPFHSHKKLTSLQSAICKENKRPAIPASYPADLQDFLKKCWMVDPSKRPSWAEAAKVLGAISISSEIEDPVGCIFWSSSFAGKKVVPWNDFHEQFFKFIGLPRPRSVMNKKSRCLRAAFTVLESRTDIGKDEVTVNTFSKILSWFGPLKARDFGILEDIDKLLSKTWFHGLVGGKEAEEIMKKHKPGTFLVRFSHSDPGSYAITVRISAGARHFRISHKPGLNYLIGKSELGSLDKIVYQFSDELNLKTPCPGSPLKELIEEDVSSSLTQYSAWGED